MACDTFIKIVVKCKAHFTSVQVGEPVPFVSEILENLTSIICDLSQPQMHVFYEAMGHIIASEQNESIQANLIEQLMSVPNHTWQDIIHHAGENTSLFLEADVLRNLIHILKTNVAACKSLGAPFFTQINLIFNDLISMYSLISQSVNQLASEQGLEVLRQPVVKLMRSVKRESLTLLSTWIARAGLNKPDDFSSRLNRGSNSLDRMSDLVLEPLFRTILQDYQVAVPEAREPKVLSLLSITIVSFKVSF